LVDLTSQGDGQALGQPSRNVPALIASLLPLSVAVQDVTPSTCWSPNRNTSSPAWGWTAQKNVQQMPVRRRWRRSPMRKPG
jgi:hypothetical protein